MSNVVYDPAKIELTIENAGTISSNITTLTDLVSTEIGNLDIRVYDYFCEFAGTRGASNALSEETATVDTFKTWMTDTYEAFEKTRTGIESPGSSTDLPTGDEPQFRIDDGNTTPGTPTYTISAEAWDKLPPDEKKAIENKLKELGFTDEEIQAIKDGNAVVNKTVLDALDNALEKLNNEGSDVRQVILEKYGFDVFNDDGTINPDKLALALIIDGRNPDDDYDLVELLKTKYGIDLFPEGTPAPGTGTPPAGGAPNLPPAGGAPNLPPAGGDTPPNNGDTPGDVTNSPLGSSGLQTGLDGQLPGTTHIGSGYGGYGGAGGAFVNDDPFGGAGADFSEVQTMVDSSSLLDGLDNLSGSMLNTGNGQGVGFGEGGSGINATGLATGAGIAGLGIAAAAGLLAKKKRDKDMVAGDGDEEFDDDEDLDFSTDEDDVLGNDLDKTTLAGSANLGINLNSGANGNSVSLDSDVDIKKKKHWLYGLGIGLAGTGLAAGLIAKDDDDEDEEETDEEFNL